MGSRRSGSEIEDQAEVKDVGDPLASFYSGLKRVDEKETTLTLLPSTIQYYFSTVLRDGLLTKEGKEEMHDKYFVGPNQFAKFWPPRLDDTKLFGLGSRVQDVTGWPPHLYSQQVKRHFPPTIMHLREALAKKKCFLLGIARITSPPLPPIRATCTTFFGRQKRRFSAYYRTK